MLKNPANMWKSDCLAKFDRPLLAHNSSFANRGLSLRLAWSSSGNERETKTGVRIQTASKTEMRWAGFRQTQKMEEKYPFLPCGKCEVTKNYKIIRSGVKQEAL
jgi:hypothetical protein